MPWTDRQARMLEAMGLRVWQVPQTPVAEERMPALAVRSSAVMPVAVAAKPPAPLPARVATAASAPAPAVRAPGAPVGPVPEHIATLGWPALREAVADCRACSLCSSRKQTVFGAGDERAHWLVVGEAPGEQEDQQGEPFVGAAGQLLDRMLQALHLTRRSDGEEPPAQRVYITNTLKCRPPHNRNPTADEVARCLPHLTRQVELLRPRIVLAMGRFAVQALLGSDEPIGKLRGRVHTLPHAGGTPAIVTYHPSYLLRSPFEKGKAWEDLCLAAATYEAAVAARPQA